MIRVCDLFCGAGGSSTGLARACEEMGVPFQLTAVNHWNVAIATHTANHPDSRHWLLDIDKAKAFTLVPERELDIMWASPSCTEHSYAKGGNDVDDQMRASAWAIPRLAEPLRPKIIIVENVPPFRNWGPVEPVLGRNGKPKLDKDGKPIHRPIKARKGETFRAWFSAIESLGYTGQWWLLNSADYGEAQTRIRWFGVFTLPGVAFERPSETHARRGDPSLMGERAPWRAAREIIDLGLSERSIFEPFLAAHFGEREGQAPRVHGIDEPFPTVTHRGAGDLAEPVLEPATSATPPERIVDINGVPHVVDVRFRMLQPYELSRAQGFPDDYVFTGSKSDQTAQIGNAVPVGVAYALIKSALTAMGYSSPNSEAAA
jgi:DNA (cytosine-5)-methyltransferase 1